MYKEVASGALYRQAAAKTDDPSAAALLSELAAEEDRHLAELKKLDAKAVSAKAGLSTTDIKSSDYLAAPAEIDGANLVDTLLFAIKQEAQSMSFYLDLMSAVSDPAAKAPGQIPGVSGASHRRRLELLYDQIDYPED